MCYLRLPSYYPLQLFKNLPLPYRSGTSWISVELLYTKAYPLSSSAAANILNNSRNYKLNAQGPEAISQKVLLRLHQGVQRSYLGKVSTLY